MYVSARRSRAGATHRWHRIVSRQHRSSNKVMASSDNSQTKKLVVVVGSTGNQGGSVVRKFLQDSRYEVRGLTRDPSSSAAQELAGLGAQIARADLDDIESLKAAFQCANIIFSVTNYWEPFFREDCRAKARELGVSCRKYAYDVEYHQGKNIADAAATVVDSLDENGFLASTLSHAGKCSNGKIKDLYHFDAKADIFPDYVATTHPQLAAKMSCIQTGFFTTSHQILPNSYFKKLANGTFEMRFPCNPDKLIPHLNVQDDMGNFVYAVHQMPPGKHFLAGEYLNWVDFAQTWADVTGEAIAYKEVAVEDMEAETPDKETGTEVAVMFAYSSETGYDGGKQLLLVEDLRKAGIECHMHTVRESLQKQTWYHVQNK